MHRSTGFQDLYTYSHQDRMTVVGGQTHRSAERKPGDPEIVLHKYARLT